MARAIATPSASPRNRTLWRRRRLRVWLRQDEAATVRVVLSTIPSLSRATLARLTDRMIDRMDEIDGDPDLEHLREGDEETHDRETAYD